VNAVAESTAGQARMARADRTRLVTLIIAWAVVLLGYVANDLAFLMAGVLILFLGAHKGYSALAPKSASNPKRTPYSLRHAARINAAPLALGALSVISTFTAALVAQTDPANPAANYLWLLALALFALAAIRHDSMVFSDLRATYLKRGLRTELALAAFITLAAFVLRVYDLRDYPPVMHGDEGEMGVIAVGILTGKTPPLFEASPFFSLPYLFNYLQAGTLALFGPNETGLRMLSVLFGTACIPLLYAIGLAGWGRVGAASAAWLMAVSHLAIHYSRQGFIFVESVFGMLLMMWLLTRIHMRSSGDSRIGLFVAIGLTMGLAQYFYYASRVMPIIAAPLLLFLWRERKVSIAQLTVTLLAALVALAPLGAYYLRHLDVFHERVGFVSILRPENVQHTLGPASALPAAALPLLQFQLTHLFQLFVRGGDAGGFYFQSIAAFDPLTSVLFWLGLGIALAQALRYHEFALLAWFGLGLTFGGILTIDAPSAQRLMVMVPAIYLFGGVCAARTWQCVARVSGWQRAGPVVLTVGAVATLLLAVNIEAYFVDYHRATQGREPNLLAHLMDAEPSPVSFYLLGAPILYSNHGAIKFLAYGIPLNDIPDADHFKPQPGAAALIFATPNHQDDLKQIAAQYRGGVETQYRDPLDRLFLLTFEIPAQDGH
jgi:4-amino-4-deoxy-L-arabinose transferase-like glycosyltransferase